MKKVALVTGFTSGLGKAVIDSLSEKGWVIYAASRAADIEKYKNTSNIKIIDIDVINDKDCEKVIQKIMVAENQIDALINIAGLTLYGPTLKFSSEDYKNIFDVNVIGAFRLAKLVYPIMQKQPKGGRIIMTTSLNGYLSLPLFGLYSSSKFALEALGQALGYELKHDNIYVTNIAPGAIANSGSRKIDHKGIRDKSFIVRLLLPMVTVSQVAAKIIDVLESVNPPVRVVIGRDAIISAMLYRYLPNRVWDMLVGRFLISR